MKAELVKQRKKKQRDITVDKHLDELFDGKVLFPAKLAQANEFLAKHPLPESLKKRDSSC